MPVIGAWLNRIRSKAAQRSIDAATNGRRRSSFGTSWNPNAEILAANPTVAARAAYAYQNNGAEFAGIEALVSNAVGTGIKPQSLHPDQKTREAINRLIVEWGDNADFGGLLDFYGIQLSAVRSMFRDGESFVRMIPEGRGKVALSLQQISPEQVDRNRTAVTANGGRIINGIEFDAKGRRIAYWVFRYPPGEPFPTSLDIDRIPADEIIHLFNPLFPGQVRGISALTPALLRLTELDQYQDAQIMRQKVAAMFAGFLTDANNTAGGFEGDQSGSSLDGGLEPGTIKVLPPGTDMRFSEPAQVGDALGFIPVIQREIAAAIGVMYEQMTGDLSQVNYSSYRAGALEFRRRIEVLQHSIIVFQLCRPIWQRFVTLAVLSGALKAPDFGARREDYFAVKWIAPGWDWVDPEKDAKAEEIAIRAGFKSRREVVAGRGEDIEALDAEIAGDNARASRLGLDFSKAGVADGKAN
ncbi:MAG: phage portal protein [Rhodospirillaceae bacterium]|nr:phage portal protein [Rhodospirillaceae bacterium]